VDEHALGVLNTHPDGDSRARPAPAWIIGRELGCACLQPFIPAEQLLGAEPERTMDYEQVQPKPMSPNLSALILPQRRQRVWCGSSGSDGAVNGPR